MSLIEGQKFADYDILASLGSGGMGEVFLARQMLLKRRVALKLLASQHAAKESFIARFRSEAALAASLDHPNIVHVFTAGQSEGIHFIEMEYIQGETLGARLADHGPMDPETALDVIYYVALALDHAWTRTKLIHRDIKPDNIFIASDGVVKLGDFGLSKSLEEWADNLTMPGTPMGSPHYMSPEQARGDREVDFRTDIYSLGCTLFHLLTGRRVFEDESPFSAAVKHINDAPPALEEVLPECPPALASLLCRMLSKDPADRQQSYPELIAEILQVRQSLQEPVKRVGGGPRAGRAPGSRKSAWILNSILAMLVLAVAALGIYVFAPWQSWLQALQATPPLTESAGLRGFQVDVSRLKPDEQLAQVMDKLRELNPAFTGKEKYTIEEGEVVELAFSSVGLTNLWPVSALPHLRSLKCAGDAKAQVPSALADLSPLRGMWLEELDCSWTQVSDLSPLRDMDLKVLHCRGCPLKDLGALRNHSLSDLDCAFTQVRDLSPLKGMPLKSLRCEAAPLKSLDPLRELPLQRLWCDRRQPRDLELILALRDLEEWNGTNVSSALQLWKGPELARRANGPRPRRP